MPDAVRLSGNIAGTTRGARLGYGSAVGVDLSRDDSSVHLAGAGALPDGSSVRHGPGIRSGPDDPCVAHVSYNVEEWPEGHPPQ